MGVIISLLYLAFVAFIVFVNWKLYVKIGKPGWAAIVPVYNVIVLLEATKKPLWWVVMILIVPVANLIFMFKTWKAVAQGFGKSEGFVWGLFLLNPIFVAMLALKEEEKFNADVLPDETQQKFEMPSKPEANQ